MNEKKLRLCNTGTSRCLHVQRRNLRFPKWLLTGYVLSHGSSSSVMHMHGFVNGGKI